MEKFEIEKIKKAYRKEIKKALDFWSKTEDKLYVVISNMTDMQTGEKVQQWYLYKDLEDVKRVFGIWRGFYSLQNGYEEINKTDDRYSYRYRMDDGHYCLTQDTVYEVS